MCGWSLVKNLPEPWGAPALQKLMGRVLKRNSEKKAFPQLKLRKGHHFLCRVKRAWRKATRGG